MSGPQSEPLEAQGVSPVPPQRQPTGLFRFVCTHNPFYLLSVCFVLNGTGRSLNRSGVLNDWLLIALLAVYVVMMAAVCYAVVRWCKVWNDARSIFFILPTLFVELSLAFDQVLFNRTEFGVWSAVGGFVFAAFVSGALLRGVRIRMPRSIRLAGLVWLATLFLYPLLLTPTVVRDARQISWGIFLFPTVTAIAMLMLLPAIRRGPILFLNNGTPWNSPWVPWSLFIFLGGCSCFRAYALSLSFDPVLSITQAEAMQLGSAFGAYFLIPMALSASILLLEGGIASRRPEVVALGGWGPVVMVWMSIPAVGRGSPYELFLQEFTQLLGMPLFVCLLFSVGFYVYAMLRGVRSAELGFIASCLLLSVVAPTMTTPARPAPIAILAACQLFLAIRRQNSFRFLFGLLLAIAALNQALLHNWRQAYQFATVYHLVLGSLLFTAICFRDTFARLARDCSVPMLLFAACGAAVLSLGFVSEIPRSATLLYLPLLTLVTLVWARFGGGKLILITGLANAGVTFAVLNSHFAHWIQVVTQWRGAWSYYAGLNCLLLGLGISAYKGKLHRRIFPQLVPDPAAPPGTSPEAL